MVTSVHGASARCAVCDAVAPAPVPGLEPNCGRVSCRHAQFRAEVEARAATERAWEERRAERNAERAQRMLDAKIASTPISERGFDPVASATVPANTGKPVPLSAQRAAEFITTLVKSAEVVFDPEIATPEAVLLQQEKPTSEIQTAACGACKGRCCSWGREHAFLDPANLAPLVDVDDPAGLAKTVAAYAARLPEVSIEESCVFHTTGGCNLPRSMRSEICNRYHCPELSGIIDEAETGAVSKFFLVAFAGEDAVGTVTVPNPDYERGR